MQAPTLEKQEIPDTPDELSDKYIIGSNEVPSILKEQLQELENQLELLREDLKVKAKKIAESTDPEFLYQSYIDNRVNFPPAWGPESAYYSSSVEELIRILLNREAKHRPVNLSLPPLRSPFIRDKKDQTNDEPKFINIKNLPHFDEYFKLWKAIYDLRVERGRLLDKIELYKSDKDILDELCVKLDFPLNEGYIPNQETIDTPIEPADLPEVLNDDEQEKLISEYQDRILFHSTDFIDASNHDGRPNTGLSLIELSGGLKTKSRLIEDDPTFWGILKGDYRDNQGDVLKSGTQGNRFDYDALFFGDNEIHSYGDVIIAYGAMDVLTTGIYFQKNPMGFKGEIAISDVYDKSKGALLSDFESNNFEQSRLMLRLDNAVIYCLKKVYPEICTKFLEHGYSPEWISRHIISYRGFIAQKRANEMYNGRYNYGKSKEEILDEETVSNTIAADARKKLSRIDSNRYQARAFKGKDGTVMQLRKVK